MSVAVTYGTDSLEPSNDKQTAEMVATYLENNTETRHADIVGLGANERLNYSDYDKVVAIGGRNANPITATATFGHFIPEPNGPGESYDIQVSEEGVQLLIIAGYNAEDTRERAETVKQDGTLASFGGGEETDSPEAPDILPTPEPTPEPEPETATHKARLSYEPQIPGAGGLVNVGAEDLADKFQEGLPPLAGWEILRVEHKEDQNIVDVYLLKKSSVSAGVILLTLAALGTAIFVAAKFSAVRMKDLRNQETELENVEDAEQGLRRIANSDKVSEENRQAARETLIEVLGESGTTGGDGSGGGPLQGLLGDLGTVQLAALVGLAALVLTDDSAPGPTIITEG